MNKTFEYVWLPVLIGTAIGLVVVFLLIVLFDGATVIGTWQWGD
jgi:hypothetical protein